MKKFFNKMRFYKNDDGVAAVEFGLIFPFIFIIYFGLIDLTGLVSTSRRVTNASSVVADLVGQNGAPFPKSNLEDYKKAVEMIMTDWAPNTIHMDVYGYRMVGTTPTRIWNYESPEGPACTGTIDTSNMADLMNGPNDLIVARVCVNFKPMWGALDNSPILRSWAYNVREITVTRPRARDTSVCSDCAAN